MANPINRIIKLASNHRHTDCWLWDGFIDKDGYGMFATHKDGKHSSKRAHRAAYELFVGDIPKGLQLDHLCRVRNCVNPKHLEPVTAKVNVLRGNAPTAKNAKKVNCKNGHKLSDENLYVCPRGKRECRTCRRESGIRRSARCINGVA